MRTGDCWSVGFISGFDDSGRLWAIWVDIRVKDGDPGSWKVIRGLRVSRGVLDWDVSAARMEAAMDLMRRMPPSLSQQALDSLLALLPAHSSELLSRSDQPLQVPSFALLTMLSPPFGFGRL